jgi:hypothetical protein
VTASHVTEPSHLHLNNVPLCTMAGRPQDSLGAPWEFKKSSPQGRGHESWTSGWGKQAITARSAHHTPRPWPRAGVIMNELYYLYLSSLLSEPYKAQIGGLGVTLYSRIGRSRYG